MKISFLIVALLTISLATSYFVDDAFAAVASGTSSSKYGSATSGIVCGDRLCSEARSDPNPSHPAPPEEVSISEGTIEEGITEEEYTGISSPPTPNSANMSLTEVHPEKMRTSAPLPKISLGPAIDFTKGYLVEEIQDGLYWVTDGAYNTMFLTTGQGVIAVDAPPSIGENYLKAIAEVTEEPVTHVIYSHTHNDHVGSISMFPDDATYISHQTISDTLTKRNDPNRPIPTVTFEDKYTLEVGTQTLELEYAGPIHEPGNIFIYAPQQKVLMLVDVVFPGWTPFKDLAMAQSVPEFLESHDKILEYDFDTYVGGHLTRLGTYEDVQVQKEYFTDIEASAAKANQEVSFMAIGQEVGFENPWLVFQVYADTITQQCTDEVVPKWIDRLGGVDLFTYDHCWKISESQRID